MDGGVGARIAPLAFWVVFAFVVTTCGLRDGWDERVSIGTNVV